MSDFFTCLPYSFTLDTSDSLSEISALTGTFSDDESKVFYSIIFKAYLKTIVNQINSYLMFLNPGPLNRDRLGQGFSVRDPATSRGT